MLSEQSHQLAYQGTQQRGSNGDRASTRLCHMVHFATRASLVFPVLLVGFSGCSSDVIFVDPVDRGPDECGFGCLDPQKPVCDSAVGECVSCLPTDNLRCNDGGNVCDPATRTCTLLPRHSKGVCELCSFDAECGPGMLCIGVLDRERFPSDTGRYCLWREDSTGDHGARGDCTNVRAFGMTARRTSTDGVEAEICLPRLTTCAALHDASNRYSCAPDFVSSDSLCGLAEEKDGYCVDEVFSSWCTVPCESDADCPIGGRREYACENVASKEFPAVCR